MYYDLKADSHREHNSYQKEIDAATKRIAEWEARYKAEQNRAKELHRLAYPERYRLSSGAELVSGWIPNRMYPSLSITTLFHGTEFKNTSYNLSQNLLDKYDSGALTLHELVNELFEPWEQVDESQHSLLAIALQTAAGGIAHRISAPAQAVHLPICHGMITTRTNSKNRSSKDGDKEVWNRMNTTEKYSVNYIGLQENIKQIP